MSTAQKLLWATIDSYAIWLSGFMIWTGTGWWGIPLTIPAVRAGIVTGYAYADERSLLRVVRASARGMRRLGGGICTTFVLLLALYAFARIYPSVGLPPLPKPAPSVANAIIACFGCWAIGMMLSIGIAIAEIVAEARGQSVPGGLSDGR